MTRNNGLVCGLKLDWKCCPPWCHGFHPGVVGNDREMTETMGGNDGETTEMGDT